MAVKKNVKKINNKPVEVIASATLKGAKMSPRKTRLVVDMVRDMQVENALNALKYSNQKRADVVHKLLQSAVYNAKEKGADVDDLWVVGAWVDEGTVAMRFKPRARGSAAPIRKRSSHITLQVGKI